MSTRHKIFFSVFFLLLFFCGCATTGPDFQVSVDSISTNEALNSKKCVILPASEKVEADDLQFKEFSKYVERVLQSKGCEITNNRTDADIGVLVGYGIGEPEENTYVYNVPIFGQTGISSAITTGAANTYGNLNTYGNNGSYSGNTSYSSTTTYKPEYGVVGSATRVESFITYSRYIFLSAYDLKEYRASKAEKQIWRSEIVSRGSSDDLRRAFPVMIAAASDYIGENPGQKVNILLAEMNEKVLRIKGIEIIKKK